MITRKVKTKKRLLKSCGCDLHIDNESRLQDLHSRNVSQSVINELVKKGIFTQRRRFLCKDCVEKYSGVSAFHDVKQIKDKSTVIMQL